MGLDIAIYQNLKMAKGNEAFDDKGELKWDENWVQFYVNPDFPGRANEIEDGKAYKGEYVNRFRAGSYGGYGVWRNTLAQLAGYPEFEYDDEFTNSKRKSHAAYGWYHPDEKLPFIELINFTDCEGVIGAEICAKLAKDFAEFQEKADQHKDDYFTKKYGAWRRAFEAASKNGVVEFH